MGGGRWEVGGGRWEVRGEKSKSLKYLGTESRVARME